MNFQVTDEERNVLLELIDGAEQSAILSMDHANSRAFKDVLRDRLRLLEKIKGTLKGETTQTGGEAA